MGHFDKLTVRGAEYVKDSSGLEVLHVSNPHALSQAVGYMKFTAKPYERIFLRGQANLYPTLPPSLYRGISSESGQNKRHKRLSDAIEVFRESCPIFNKFPGYAHEPLLQHYGIKTTWVDIVDNVWVGLWFSIYQAFAEGKNSEFLHFDVRTPTVDAPFGYLLLLAASEDRRSSPMKGMMRGRETEVIDLRIAAPSIFLRPHAQHGLLLRAKGTRDGRILDYSNAVRGIIRYNLNEAIEWLGSGNMVGVRGLFPPPYFDGGYRILLSAPHKDFSVGSIHHVGA